MTKETAPIASIEPDSLEALLRDLGLTPIALADRLGMTTNAVYQWLRGVAPAPFWLAEHLALLLALQHLSGRWIESMAAPSEPLPARLSHLGDKVKGDKTNSNIQTGLIYARIDPMSKHSDKPHTMDGADLQKALSALGLKQAAFARRMGLTTNTVSRWATDAGPIPAWVPVHLSLLLEVKALHARFVQP